MLGDSFLGPGFLEAQEPGKAVLRYGRDPRQLRARFHSSRPAFPLAILASLPLRGGQMKAREREFRLQ